MLNFQKRKKRYFDVVLHDGTELKIPAPTLGVFSALQEIAQDPQNVEEGQVTELVGVVLRTNKDKIEITEEQIQAFDYDDMLVFFTDYSNFIIKVLDSPNLKSPVAR